MNSLNVLVWLNLIQLIGILVLLVDNHLNRRAAFKTLDRVAALVDQMVKANQQAIRASEGWRGPG